MDTDGDKDIKTNSTQIEIVIKKKKKRNSDRTLVVMLQVSKRKNSKTG